MKKILILAVGFMLSIGCFSQEVKDDLYDNTSFADMAHMSVYYLASGKDYIMRTKVFNTEDKLSKLNRLIAKVERTIQLCDEYTLKFREGSAALEGYTKGEIRSMKKDAEADAYGMLSAVKKEYNAIKYDAQKRIRDKMTWGSMLFNVY